MGVLIEGGLTTGVGVFETDLATVGFETTVFFCTSVVFGASGRLVRVLVTGLVNGKLVFAEVELTAFGFAGNFSATGLAGSLLVNVVLAFTTATLVPEVKLLVIGFVTALVTLVTPVVMDNFRTGRGADSLTEVVESATADLMVALAGTGFGGLVTIDLTGVGFKLEADLLTVTGATLVDAIFETTGFNSVLLARDVVFGAAIGVF